MLAALLLGLGIGALVAAQVGPVWLLCARTAALYGFRAGAAIGLGVAAVDLAYAVLGALGIGVLVTNSEARLLLGILGSLVLGYYAFTTLRTAWLLRNGLELTEVDVQPRAGFRTGVLVTASNPLTILSWAAIFGGATVSPVITGTATAAVFVIGTGLGSLLWHLGLSLVFNYLGPKLGRRGLIAVDVASGIGFAGFAGAIGANAVSAARDN